VLAVSSAAHAFLVTSQLLSPSILDWEVPTVGLFVVQLGV
jgi:hypothetical protein